MRRIAIIPARGGSKRIPRKNVKPFMGKPIIAYPIEAAVNSCLFDEVMVSTDDEEIAEIAREHGAVVPFMRTPETSDDEATLAQVISEVLACYEKEGRLFDSFCCILPTAVLLSSGRLEEGCVIMESKGYDSVFPVVRFSYPVQRSLKIEKGVVSMTYPEYMQTRSQDLEPMYHDSGQFYWMKAEEFLTQRTLYAENSGAMILPETEVQDIDTEEDWWLAGMKYTLMNTSQ